MDTELKTEPSEASTGTSKISIIRYFNNIEFPDGDNTERRYVTRLDSSIVYTEGCIELGQPGIVFLLGPNKGEMPIRAEAIIEQSKSVGEIIFAIVMNIKRGNPPPVPRDTLYDATGRQYVVTNSQLLIDSMKVIIADIDPNGGKDYQVDPIVFIPICGEDTLIFGRTSRAVH